MARLLSLDFDPVYGAGKEVVRASFSGDTSVFDFDVVIWDPAGSFENYSSYSDHYQGLPSLGDSRSVQIQADAKRRRDEFVDFINAGKALIVIARPPQACYVDTGQRTYSGTGRNRATTTHVAKFDLLSALPIQAATSFTPAQGDRIEIVGDGPLPSLLRKYLTSIGYYAVIKDTPGNVLARVSGTERIVSFAQRTKNGGLLAVIPYPDFTDPDYDEDEDEDASGFLDDKASQFQTDLLEAISSTSGVREESRPGWAQRYATKSQREAQEGILQQEKLIERARTRLSKLTSKKDELDAADQLYLGSGRALELEVRTVLEMMGGEVTEPEPGRDDWKVRFPEGDAVVEVKGVGKSAAEKHAAQLEKWVASAMDDDGKTPKGLLIVNTWRNTPLSERTGEDFPAQMIPYCRARNHCLITGLQLFTIRHAIEQDAKAAARWRKKILKTSGQLTGTPVWSDIISEESTETSESEAADTSKTPEGNPTP